MVEPLLIGIAGPSCSGKSSLAGNLLRQLGTRASVLSLDAYYRDLGDLDPGTRTAFNFDVPAALDAELLMGHVGELARGLRIETPVYDFTTHSRTGRTIPVDPCPVILVEGLFALYWESVRRHFDLKVFVHAPDEICLERRLKRDEEERGRSRESIVAQFEGTVRPMCHRYVLPTMAYADLVMNGLSERQGAALQVLARLADKSTPHVPRTPAPSTGCAAGSQRVRVT